MNEQQFPGQHTTTVTMNTTAVQTNIRYDRNYIKTVPGILKVVELVFDLLGFICIMVSALSYHSRGSYFSTVSMAGFWFTAIIFVFYMFHVIEKFYKIPWLKIEFIFYVVLVFLYLIAASLAVGFNNEAYSAAGFFGYCAMLAYGYDAFLKFKAIRAGELAQGQRIISQQTTTVDSVRSPVY